MHPYLITRTAKYSTVTPVMPIKTKNGSSNHAFIYLHSSRKVPLPLRPRPHSFLWWHCNQRNCSWQFLHWQWQNPRWMCGRGWSADWSLLASTDCSGWAGSSARLWRFTASSTGFPKHIVIFATKMNKVTAKCLVFIVYLLSTDHFHAGKITICHLNLTQAVVNPRPTHFRLYWCRRVQAATSERKFAPKLRTGTTENQPINQKMDWKDK